MATRVVSCSASPAVRAIKKAEVFLLPGSIFQTEAVDRFADSASATLA